MFYLSSHKNIYSLQHVFQGHERAKTFIVYCMFFRGMNELKNLQYLPRASEPRETMVEDRTRCHADHVGHGFDRFTTAAVGLLKAVNCGEKYVPNSFWTY